jgi:hypothetical protein
VERGCYFFLTLPPEALLEPELREPELRDALPEELLEPEDDEPTRAVRLPDVELPLPTDDLLGVPRALEGREEGPVKVLALAAPPSP